MTRNLDFVIIGAQKSGTTTLHELLKDHPGIALPIEKEAPFFHLADVTESAWFNHVDHEYGATGGKLIGKCSPQYMSTPFAANTVNRLFPSARIIAILREPISRAYSHYRMCLRRGQITSSFEEAAREWMKPESLKVARSLPHIDGNEAQCCLVWSEYSRLLQPWINLFGRSNVLVLYTADLEARPSEVLATMLEFIGADSGWVSPNLGKTFLKGGSRTKLSVLRPLRRIKVIDRLVPALIGILPRRLKHMLQLWNVRPDSDDGLEMSVETRAALTRHFARDSTELRALGYFPPWTN
jgi:hypothetical protein